MLPHRPIAIVQLETSCSVMHYTNALISLIQGITRYNKHRWVPGNSCFKKTCFVGKKTLSFSTGLHGIPGYCLCHAAATPTSLREIFLRTTIDLDYVDVISISLLFGFVFWYAGHIKWRYFQIVHHMILYVAHCTVFRYRGAWVSMWTCPCEENNMCVCS